MTENPSAFRKWMVSGPEQARLLKEFEEQYQYKQSTLECGHHHEEGLAAQKTFKEEVTGLVEVFNKMGNPFLDDSDELLALDTRKVLDESVVKNNTNDLQSRQRSVQ